MAIYVTNDPLGGGVFMSLRNHASRLSPRSLLPSLGHMYIQLPERHPRKPRYVPNLVDAP